NLHVMILECDEFPQLWHFLDDESVHYDSKIWRISSIVAFSNNNRLPFRPTIRTLAIFLPYCFCLYS
ncbi:MAG: hypothetical protein ACK5P3_02115, partial [Dolichospermum sp.]